MWFVFSSATKKRTHLSLFSASEASRKILLKLFIMPIEIRELIFSTTVVPQAQQVPQTAETAANDPLSMEVKENLIQACVSQVIELLEKEKER
jgi:Family of unknown function (DUF5908)